jgi:hypothetical protein
VGVIGIILVKQMIAAVIIGKSVGIVHPADSGRKMESRPVLFMDQLLVFFFVSSSVL